MPNQIYQQLLENSLWMSWNVWLALIPFLLAGHLFHPRRKHSLLWGFGVSVFILFLPNAPYIFTDLIHLYHARMTVDSALYVFLFTGQFVLLELAGYYLFVISYRKFEIYILRHLYPQRYLVRLASFLTLSVGVYLGRFLRFNSWDVLTQPLKLITSLDLLIEPAAVVFITGYTVLLFLVFTLHEGFLHEKSLV